jgi:hypothetical protein
MLDMRGQEFFGGAAAVWPGIGEAQQTAAMPRIGALIRPRRDPKLKPWQRPSGSWNFGAGSHVQKERPQGG